MTENDDAKAIVVLTQEEIDTAIHGLEEAGFAMDREQFEEVYGDVYQKLHAIENEGGENEYRVK
jgi:glutathionyl-hydroquinone reductase